MPDRLDKSYELFQRALQLPAPQRSSFLAQACGTDIALLAEVASLLAHDQQAGESFLRSPVVPPAGLDATTPAANASPASPPDAGALAKAAFQPDVNIHIEGYQITRELSRGGQGVVYQAIQKATKRKVAIKVMREGPFAGKGERARFEREVEILGQLNHPNIVTVHDSGTASGCYYFVMDYISGQPLDVWMAQEERSIKETLKLFMKICDAINATHLKGIIHRDLKPGNIRIDDKGEPHILDFGLAKVAQGIDAASLMTMTGQFMGSLPWASPEQAEARPALIDIRTDVYSLGIILYQMLTGKFPYEVMGNMRDVLDRILKAEPTKPSTIRRQINDEVETIVLKSLSKERERRYQTAGELARDIGHYLAGEPIEAKRDSGWYVLRKNLRRHRGPVVAAGAVVLVLMVGLAVTTWQWRRADERAEAATRAESREAEARKITETKSKEADAARRIAEQKTEETKAALTTIEYNSYVANVLLAGVAMELRQFDRARQRLDACAKSLRGWEWGWLDATADTSLAELKGHTQVVTSAGFSPDGTRIVTVSTDGTARVWEMATGASLIELTGHTDRVRRAEFSPDGTRIVTASDDKTARVWDSVPYRIRHAERLACERGENGAAIVRQWLAESRAK